jgi:hypothetical protein
MLNILVAEVIINCVFLIQKLAYNEALRFDQQLCKFLGKVFQYLQHYQCKCLCITGIVISDFTSPQFFTTWMVWGLNPTGGVIFRPSRPALGPIQPPVQ